MADNKSKTSEGDRKRVAGGQPYEVSYFARKHGLSTSEARTLIEQVGNDREKLNAEAKKLAASGPGERRTRGKGGRTSNRDTAPKSRKASTAPSGALTKVAALGGVIAAGALLWARRGQISGKRSEEITIWRRDSEAGPHGDVESSNEKTASASPAKRRGGKRSQTEIAEEALALKNTGQAEGE